MVSPLSSSKTTLLWSCFLLVIIFIRDNVAFHKSWAPSSRRFLRNGFSSATLKQNRPKSIPLLHSYSTMMSRSTALFSSRVPVVPYFLNKYNKREGHIWMDIYNVMGRDRVLFVSRYLDDDAINTMIASLLYLQGKSEKEKITLFLNIPGGEVRQTFTVLNVLQKLTCPIETINMGLTCGPPCILAAAGTKGLRSCFPNSRFLVGKGGFENGMEGQAADLYVEAKNLVQQNNQFVSNLATLCGQTVEKVSHDLKRDFYLTATEATEYGIVDKVLQPMQIAKLMKNRGIDNDVINFGHFSETHRVISRPDEVLPKIEVEEEVVQETKKTPPVAGSPLNERFSNARCKPIDYGKLLDDGTDGGKSDMFKNF